MERAADPVVWVDSLGEPIAVRIDGRVQFVTPGRVLDQPDADALLDDMDRADYYELRRAVSYGRSDQGDEHRTQVWADIRRRRTT